MFVSACKTPNANMNNVNTTAAEILGNSNYPAISYGGYRKTTRDVQPTMAELKDDMKILHAMGIRVIRTYNVHLPQAKNILKAIAALKKENADFEMYVMLGAWIDCLNAWTDKVRNHYAESERNEVEIQTAVTLANAYPDIVKIIAVGNEAMVKWATDYYVQPSVILKWVTHLQELKKEGALPKSLWITSSDNFASWGGGGAEYHSEDLEKLIAAVDYISVHTYPFHDTHYNPSFWHGNEMHVNTLTLQERIDAAMLRSLDYAVNQFNNVKKYVESLGIKKPIHMAKRVGQLCQKVFMAEKVHMQPMNTNKHYIINICVHGHTKTVCRVFTLKPLMNRGKTLTIPKVLRIILDFLK